MNDAADPQPLWQNGYSMAELWGNSDPVSRGGPALSNNHLIMWGILSIVNDQVGPGAGHVYLRERLWKRDWIAIGLLNEQMVVVPPVADAKFGRKPSAIGDDVTKYTKVRVIHGELYEALTTRPGASIAPSIHNG
jgi:hypothetical protein